MQLPIPPALRRSLTVGLAACAAAWPVATLGSAGAIVTVSMVASPTAHAAGTYVHNACASGSAVTDAYGGWTSFNAHPGQGMSTLNTCPGGGLQGDITPSNGYSFPVGSALGWNYNPPANTYISAFGGALSGWLDAWDGSNQGFLELTASSGRLHAFTSSRNGELWPSAFTFNRTGLHDSSLAVRMWCDAPSTSYPACASPWQTGWFRLANPRTTLADDAAPVPGTISGSAKDDTKWVGNENFAYAATDQGGGIYAWRLYVDGVQAMSYVPDTFAGHCAVQSTSGGDWVFGFPKPCPGSVSDTKTIDTTQIADGQHTITAKVVDAGQREATLFSATRLVANHPPVLQTAPAYTTDTQVNASTAKVGVPFTINGDGSWSGPNLTFVHGWQQCDAHGANCSQIPGATGLSYTPTEADIGRTLRFAVTATNPADSVNAYSQPTSIVSAASSTAAPVVKPTDGANGSNGSNGSNGATGTGSASIISPGVSAPTNTNKVEHLLIGRVVGEPAGTACPQDKATLVFQHIKGAKLKLGFNKAGSAQLALTCSINGKAIADAKLEIATTIGNKPVVAADVTTDGAGHATIRLGKGASRAVTVAYRMYSDDALARATATLKVVVAGKVRLKASRKRLRNGQVVTLKGALAGGNVPARGVHLSVQWKDGKRWRPFAQIKTDRKGAFRYAYRFTRTGKKVVYALRVHVVKGQIDYPFEAVASRAIKVTVAP